MKLKQLATTCGARAGWTSKEEVQLLTYWTVSWPKVAGSVGYFDRPGSYSKSKVGRRILFLASGPKVCGQDSVKGQGIKRALLSAACRHKMGSLAGAVLTAAGGFLLLGSFFYAPALQTRFPDPA